MEYISQLARYLESLGLQNNAPRTAFYNYLKNWCSGQDKLTIGLFYRFYRLFLHSPHWEEHRNELKDSLCQDLYGFEDFIGLGHHPFSIEMHKYDLQTLPVEGLKNVRDMCLGSLQQQGLTPNSTHVQEIPNKGVLIIWQTEHTLEARAYSNKALLDNGKLKPLLPKASLSYDKNLELLGTRKHWVQTPEFWYLFTSVKNKFEIPQILGTVFKGYQMTPSNAITEEFPTPEGESQDPHGVAESAPLYKTLEGLEKHYIHGRENKGPIALLSEVRNLILSSSEEPEIHKNFQVALDSAKSALVSGHPQHKEIYDLMLRVQNFYNQRFSTPIESAHTSE